MCTGNLYDSVNVYSVCGALVISQLLITSLFVIHFTCVAVFYILFFFNSHAFFAKHCNSQGDSKVLFIRAGNLYNLVMVYSVCEALVIYQLRNKHNFLWIILWVLRSILFYNLFLWITGLSLVWFKIFYLVCAGHLWFCTGVTDFLLYFF